MFFPIDLSESPLFVPASFTSIGGLLAGRNDIRAERRVMGQEPWFPQSWNFARSFSGFLLQLF
jgi:hypothetical protein